MKINCCHSLSIHRLTVSNVSVCGHFYLMYAEECYDNLIRNPTEQAQVSMNISQTIKNLTI